MVFKSLVGYRVRCKVLFGFITHCKIFVGVVLDSTAVGVAVVVDRSPHPATSDHFKCARSGSNSQSNPGPAGGSHNDSRIHLFHHRWANCRHRRQSYRSVLLKTQFISRLFLLKLEFTVVDYYITQLETAF